MLGQSLQFRPYAPAPDLAPYVERIWILQGCTDSNPVPERILPDGRPELIVHRGEPFWRHSGSARQQQPRLILAGQMASPVVVSAEARARVDVIGITFRPHAISSFLHGPAESITDCLMDLAEVDAASAESLSTGHIEETLRRRIRRRPEIDRIAAAAVKCIEGGAGLRPIPHIARDLGISERHLQRSFERHVGLSPKRFSRIDRFQTALRALSDDSSLNRLDIALRQGYYDQSHFAHEFHDFAGVAPTELLERLDSLTRFFLRP